MTDTGAYEDTGGNYWDHARREYLSGTPATTICQRYGVSLSSFRLHARAGGWRRMDRPECDIPPEPGEYHPEDPVSFAGLATQAFLNIRRALGGGRAAEAASWLRVYDKLAERARTEVMSDLPDAPPPEQPEEREPLRLFLMEDDEAPKMEINALEDSSGFESEQVDSLDSVFSESNPVSASEAEASPVEPSPDAQPPFDRDAVLLLRERRLELGLGVSDLDAALQADDAAHPANPP